jgi:tRNA-dihydrouridine synthase
MAGMTDTAFRRLVKRRGGCGLVVTEMVSSEGSCAGSIARSSTPSTPKKSGRLDSDLRRRSGKMADAAQIVEGMGADIVDVNMGCPVPKIAEAQRRAAA